ncbi:MAG: hypothetical protein H0V25_03525 [Solirubrobacterales bacterium]|nr:hypothetical protein [Solirubrobacterales bacterium]
MAKMQREQKVRERRLLKQGKKDAAAAACTGEVAESGPATRAAPDEAASGPSS